MRLNVSKCKLIHFATKKDDQLPISLANTQLEAVSSYKYLGIDITDKLDSDKYWDRLSSSIRQNIALPAQTTQEQRAREEDPGRRLQKPGPQPLPIRLRCIRLVH